MDADKPIAYMKLRRLLRKKYLTPSRFPKRTGQCIAKIAYKGEKIYLGTFQTNIEAARAYDRAARQYHGPFARLNFPEEWLTGQWQPVAEEPETEDESPKTDDRGQKTEGRRQGKM
jgi:hypothetical protein